MEDLVDVVDKQKAKTGHRHVFFFFAFFFLAMAKRITSYLEIQQ